MIKDNLNALRAWAILGVIAIHVSMNFTKLTELNWLPVTLAAIDIYAHFAVPLFVSVSGFVLALRYKDNFSKKIFYNKRSRILLPFILWSLLYMSINPGQFKEPFQALFDIITGRSYYHLWFFFLIIQLYIVFPFLTKLLKNKNLWILIFILALQVSFRQVREVMPGSDNMTLLFKGFFFSYIFYFSFGIWISYNLGKSEKMLSKISFSRNLVIFITTVAFSFLFSFNWLAEHNGFFDRNPLFMLLEKIILPFVFIMTFANLIGLSGAFKSKKALHALNILSKFSFGIYLSHALFLRIIIRLLTFSGITWENTIFYPVSFAATVIVSVLFCYIIEKTPFSKPLLGIDRQKSIT